MYYNIKADEVILIKIKATPKFLHLAQKIMSDQALQELIDNLALCPEQGVVLQGTGGIRKMRWRTGKDDRGKSGGIRILYYYEAEVLTVLLITLFKKSEKENIDAREKTQLKKLLPELLRMFSDE